MFKVYRREGNDRHAISPLKDDSQYVFRATLCILASNYTAREAHNRNTRIARVQCEKDKTPNHDSVVLVQDDRMGFHICIVGY